MILKSNAVFKCPGSYAETIPAEIANKIGYAFPQAHTNMKALVEISKEVMKYKDDSICKLPFCLTVEAESMGANINLGNKKNGPQVRKYVFNHIEELEDIQDVDFNKGRIKEVLGAVAYLNKQKQMVALNIEGPFTILSYLIEPIIIYKAMRKDSVSIERCLKIIEDNIVNYASEGLNKGVRILSYADPVGSMDIVGPQIYKAHSGRVTYNILQRLTTDSNNALIHICGKTSTALEQTGFSKLIPLGHDENLTYSDVIFDLVNTHENMKIIGHSCFQQIVWKRKAPVIWEVKLNSG